MPLMKRSWMPIFCLMLSILSACHAGPRIERAAREVKAEQEAEQQAEADAPAEDATAAQPEG
jgi:uncharacterized lipoprotein